MQDGVIAPLETVRGRLGSKHVLVAEGHCTDVFHSAHVVLGAENLVVLIAEGVGAPECGVVEVEAVLGLGEQAPGI